MSLGFEKKSFYSEDILEHLTMKSNESIIFFWMKSIVKIHFKKFI